MPPRDLTANECRVIGCLLEKSVTTPDQYPLTLNALTNACNQKSSREPVMNLSQGAVQNTVRLLEEQHLLRVEDNFKRGTEKYSHRFCNTSFSELQFDAAQYAIVTLLLLRIRSELLAARIQSLQMTLLDEGRGEDLAMPEGMAANTKT